MGRKSFRKIPNTIQVELERCAGESFVIFALVDTGPGDVFPNLPGLRWTPDAEPEIPESILPDPTKGTWACRNVEGWEIIRKDLPMETKTFSNETPNFGDWSKGSHEVTRERDVYQREYLAGYGTPISVRQVRRSGNVVTLAFELDRVFDEVPADSRELLFALNVFQEAVGQAHVKPTDKPADSFIRAQRVDWELLPLGEREALVARLRDVLKPTEEEDRILTERLDLLYELRPAAVVVGTSHFARYIGGKFRDDFVVFENYRYGNAIYAMFGDWEELSKLSRTELLNTRTSGEDYVRIVHRAGWQRRLKAIVREYRHRGRH